MASKCVLISMLLIVGAVAQDEKELKVAWEDSHEMGEKLEAFAVAEGLDKEEWSTSVIYADGSVDDPDKHDKEDMWPITIKFVKKSSLSEAAAAEAEEEAKKKAEEEAAAAAAAEAKAAEETRLAEEAKAKAEAEKKAADEKAAREEEERLKAEEAALKAKEEEEAALAAKLKAEEEAKALAEAAAQAAEAEKAAAEAAAAAAAEEAKRQAEEAAAKAAEAKRLKEEEERQAEEARIALAEQEAAAKAASLRNIKWRWADNGPFMIIKWIPKSPFEDKWTESESRDDLKNQINDKVLKSAPAEKKNKEYETRRVELADMEDPTRKRTFENYVKVIEWLMLEHNIAGASEEL